MRYLLVFLLGMMVLPSPVAAAPSPKNAESQQVSIIGVNPELDTQETQVVLANFPRGADPATVRWGIVVSYDNAASVFLQSSSGSWVRSVLGADQSGSNSVAPTKQPLVRRKTQSIFLLNLPADTLSKHVMSVLVTISIPASESVSFDGKPFQWTPPATIYVSGLYSPAFHSQAQYTIDAEGVFTVPVKAGSDLRWGGAFNVATDNRPTADPDSYTVAGLLGWARNRPFFSNRGSGVVVQWNVAEFEFDRETTTQTLVSSPVAQTPIFLFSRPGRKQGSPQITPYGGLEIGTNLSNSIASGGSGFVFRGLIGASFSGSLKLPWKNVSQLEITVNYNVRLPTTNEVFTNTHFISATNNTVTLPIYSTQARHHLTDELDVTLQKPIALSIKHEYGELPPGFREVDNKVSIGITVMLSHTNSAGWDKVTQSKW